MLESLQNTDKYVYHDFSAKDIPGDISDHTTKVISEKNLSAGINEDISRIIFVEAMGRFFQALPIVFVMKF